MADSDIASAGDVETIITLIEYRGNIFSECESKLKTLKEEKNELVSRKSKLGLFKSSEKERLEQLIKEKDNEIAVLSKETKDAKNNLDAFDEFVPHLQALKTELDKYEAGLVRIENEFTLEGFKGDMLKR